MHILRRSQLSLNYHYCALPKTSNFVFSLFSSTFSYNKSCKGTANTTGNYLFLCLLTKVLKNNVNSKIKQSTNLCILNNWTKSTICVSSFWKWTPHIMLIHVYEEPYIACTISLKPWKFIGNLFDLQIIENFFNLLFFKTKEFQLLNTFFIKKTLDNQQVSNFLESPWFFTTISLIKVF